jgi:hypothetical protein
MRRTRLALAVVVLLSLVAAACGGGGDKKPAAPASTTTTRPERPVIAPLTGLRDRSGASATRPALIVKIDNIPLAQRHTEQQGIEAADIVWEEPVEGTTRLFAVFNSHSPERVGPVRSTRYIDAGIGWFFGHVPFVYSGGGIHQVEAVKASPMQVIDESGLAAIHANLRDRSIPAPHNLFTSPKTVWTWAAEKSPPAPVFRFLSKGRRFPGVAVGKIQVPNDNLATYTWDAAAKAWKRDQIGSQVGRALQPHMTASGKQIAPTNVIVQKIGAGLMQQDTIGEGDAWILSQGRLLKAHWSRPKLEDRTVFTDDSGKEVALTPGTTWISLITSGEPRRLG